MNTKRRALVLTLALAALPGLGAQTAIDQLYGLRNYELADAYWAAGQKFTDLGQAERGAEFKAKAVRIFPGYVPGQAPAVTAVSAPSTPSVPAPAAVREENLQGQKIARLQFQKLLRGYLTGSAATVVSVLSTSLDVQGQAVSPGSADVARFLQEHPTEAGSPDDLFQLETLQVSDGAGQQVLVTVSPNPDAALGALLSFWTSKQVYTFDRVGDTWKLVAIAGL